MNRQTAPTDWKGSVMQKRIAGRYAAERRFKLFGLGAVLLSGAFLAFLLFVWSPTAHALYLYACRGAVDFRRCR